MFLEGTADFHRALRRCYRAGVKDQPHAVARWNLNSATSGFGCLILIRTADDFGQLVNHRPLFVNRKLRVADDVDEQDVRDLKLDLFLNLSGHLVAPGRVFGKLDPRARSPKSDRAGAAE